MSAAHGRTLQVVAEGAGSPRTFLWRGRQIHVREILEDWEEAGCWWLGETPRRIYRVLGGNDVVYELHHQGPSGWHLHRVFD